MRSTSVVTMVAAVAVLAATACTSGGGAAGTTAGTTGRGAAGSPGSASGVSPQSLSTSPLSTSSPATGSPAARRATAAAQRALSRLSLAERVGQLLMVDCPTTSVGPNTVTAIQQYHVGSVILDGTSREGLTVTQGVTSQLQQLAPAHDKLFISTDQEGGLVQRLRGTGFSVIPTAVDQGQLDPSTLQADATVWAKQLKAAGVNVNLAPVLDTVPANWGSNPPIGDLDREYGHDPATVTSHGTAYARGMAAGGIDATVKHFPGLGRTRGNTDTTVGVTDVDTTRHDAYLQPFATAIRQGVPFVMVSSAIYTKIDPNNIAAFSPTVINGMLRHDLHFQGVVISDDLGNAAAASTYPVGERAVRFVQAGGDMVLTVDASQAQAMTQALLQKAQQSRAFRAIVDLAVLHVLVAKYRAGLIS